MVSRIYINLCEPYKYVKRAPSSLPFHTSIISYTESRTGHLVYYAIIFTQANLAMIQKYHVFIVVPGVLGNTIKNSWSLALMNLIILPQISLTNCYLGYCIRFYFCLYSRCKNCSSHFFLKTSILVSFPSLYWHLITLPPRSSALPTLSRVVAVPALLTHLPRLCCLSVPNSLCLRNSLLFP